MLGVSDEIYEMMFPQVEETDVDDSDDLVAKYHNFRWVKDNVTWQNTSSSTLGKIEESVDDIRRNAPEQFKIGNRLVTTSDWEYYIRNRFKDNILDVVC